MRTQVGVGWSVDHESFGAGCEAALAAWTELGEARAGLILVFATAGHDQNELLRGVTAVTGSVPLSGCSAEGVITRRGSDEGTHAVGVMAICSETMRFSTLRSPAVSKDSRRCAAELAKQLADRNVEQPRLLLLFPDGMTANCTEFLQALESVLPFPVLMAGGSAGETLQYGPTYQYLDGTAESDAVSAILICGNVVPEIAVSHGCDLLGIEQTITRAERGLVYEIEGRPAWEFFKEYLGPAAQALDPIHVPYACLAQRLPAGTDSEYGDHIVRSPIRLEPETGAVFFSGGFETGARVHFALRNIDRVAEHAVDSVRSIADKHPGEAPALVLQFDCTGRGRLLFGDDVSRM